MRPEQLTTSAATFYNCEQDTPIPSIWLEKALCLFTENGLAPILFNAGGGEFELDDCYVFADSGGDLFKWGEAIAARRNDLVKALRQGDIYSLGLDAPRAGAETRSDSQAETTILSSCGTVYVGIDEELESDPVVLLHRAYEMAKGLFDVRYGIAYKMPLTEEPASYAVGSGPFSLADFRELMRLKREGIQRPKSPDDLWRDELNGRRRHLQNLFRGAYPASILSESHVRAAALDTRPIGRLTQLDSLLWLWELSESEIPQAESLLAERKLLVSQAAES